jgi:hypothetical protein
LVALSSLANWIWAAYVVVPPVGVIRRWVLSAHAL